MPDKITTALLGLACTIAGIFLGWYLKEVSQSRKEQSDKYQEALAGVRSVLERVLTSSGPIHNPEIILAYLMALGRLEPYAERVGRDRFRQLRDVLLGEMMDYRLALEHALASVNHLLSKRP